LDRIPSKAALGPPAVFGNPVGTFSPRMVAAALERIGLIRHAKPHADPVHSPPILEIKPIDPNVLDSPRSSF
jgi:hypothetical protein